VPIATILPRCDHLPPEVAVAAGNVLSLVSVDGALAIGCGGDLRM
jgi:hypothetical protein